MGNCGVAVERWTVNGSDSGLIIPHATKLSDQNSISLIVQWFSGSSFEFLTKGTQIRIQRCCVEPRAGFLLCIVPVDAAV